jgi:hypothetical protein
MARLPAARPVGLILALSFAGIARADVPPVPIPQGPGGETAPKFIGSPAEPKPIEADEPPRHPFMARNGDSNIHNDAYQTDAYWRKGPLGLEPEVISTYQQAECASLTFDTEGRIVTVCVGLEGPRVVMIDPKTLATMATLPLPPRQQVGGVFNEFAGGGYFYLDHKDRAVVPTNDRRIWVVSERETSQGPAFEVTRIFELPPVEEDEGIVSALPDWSGLVWFVTNQGLVGTLDRHTGDVRAIRLHGEVIANSFMVDETGGVFIVSDHALYRFHAGPGGTPKADWRQPYDRGTRVKPGQVSQGSGTTPTLLGDRYVAITDNADPRMHVLVFRRDASGPGPTPACRKAVFAEGESATDNSLIGVGRSLVVENNYGYSGPAATSGGDTTTPGLARIKLDQDGQGCDVVWTSDEIAPSVVPKLSLKSGLVYTYTKEPNPDGDDLWYFTAIRFGTGKTVWKRLTGEGLGYNNNYAPVSLRQGGAAYVGVLGGLVMVRDG